MRREQTPTGILRCAVAVFGRGTAMQAGRLHHACGVEQIHQVCAQIPNVIRIFACVASRTYLPGLSVLGLCYTQSMCSLLAVDRSTTYKKGEARTQTRTTAWAVYALVSNRGF